MYELTVVRRRGVVGEHPDAVERIERSRSHPESRAPGLCRTGRTACHGDGVTKRLAGLGVAATAESNDDSIHIALSARDEQTLISFLGKQREITFQPVSGEPLQPGVTFDLGDPYPTVTVGPSAGVTLGPGLAAGGVLDSAEVMFDGGRNQWVIRPTFTSEGIAAFNRMAEQCYARQPSCATGQIAVVVDGRIIAAPLVQSPQFSSDSTSFSAGSNEQSARDLATAINQSLPVGLKVAN